MNISSNKQFIELFLAQLELNAPHAPLHLEFVAYSFLHFLPPLQINIISWTILEYLKQIIKLLRRKKLFTDNIPFTAYLKLLGTNIFRRHLSTAPTNFVLLSFQLESWSNIASLTCSRNVLIWFSRLFLAFWACWTYETGMILPQASKLPANIALPCTDCLEYQGGNRNLWFNEQIAPV